MNKQFVFDKTNERQQEGRGVVPVEKSEQNKTRILAIDVLRGISLLGIFLVNMLSFHSPYFYYNPYEWWQESGDRFAFSAIDIFVQGSFYPLFACLFGFGAAMQKEKVLQGGKSFVWTGLRRFTFLLALGVMHALFIWPGDILFNYAVCGFALLLFLRFSGKILLMIGLFIWLVPAMLLILMLWIAAVNDPYSMVFWTDIASVSESIAAYSSGTYAEVTGQRITDWTRNNIESGALLFQFITIFPFLLIGAGVFKQRLLEKWTQNTRYSILFFVIFFLIGVSIKAVSYLIKPDHLALMYLQDAIGGPLLGASYAFLVIAICQTSWAAEGLKPIAAAGKMSLSNYLAQSLFGTFVFYSYGLHYYGQITVMTGVWLCAAFYAVQLAASSAWLSKFQTGPVEWVWRKVTYLKRRN